VKVIVFKNDVLPFVELDVKAAGMLDFGTDLLNPDFSKIAEAGGVLGLRAEQPEQVRSMIAEALPHAGPALVEVTVPVGNSRCRRRFTLDQAKGFGLFMLKAVLSGRGSEIIDLAKTNLSR
jgi:pyruvate dehydrogenase (quinone)